MELDVSKLAADGLRLQFDGPGDRIRSIVLDPTTGVSGRYATTARAYVVDATSDQEMTFSEVRWPTESVDVSLDGARLSRAAVDIKIKRKGGTVGQIGAREITVDKFALQLTSPGEPIVLRKVKLDRPGLALGDKALALVCQKAGVERVEFHIGGISVVLHGVHVTGLRIRRGQGVWLILAETITARRVSVKRGEISLMAENVEAQTVGVDGKVVRLARLFAPRAHLSGARLAAIDPAGDVKSEEASTSGARPAINLDALDGLDGKINVDLTADATVPFLGRRRATHHFRLDVDSGTINFHRLEKSLSTLEDAVLDFRVKGNDLVLERDIPLMKKTLVSWPLQSRDMALAQRQLVRIARLFDYRVETDEGDAPAKDSKRSLELRELSFDGLDVELALAGGAGVDLPWGGRLLLGEDGRPALDDLTIRGSVRFKPGANERTKLDVSASMLNIGLNAMRLGNSALSISAISVHALEKGSIRFAGVKPDGIDATLRDVELLSIRLVPG